MGRRFQITVLTGTENTGNFPENLFDNDVETKWCTADFAKTGAYVIFKLNKTAHMTGYSITDGNDTYSSNFYGRHWDSWTIYGANFTSDESATKDAVEWQKVESRSEQQYTWDDVCLLDNYAQPTHSYKVKGAEGYQYYKLEITGIGVCTHEWDDQIDNAQQMAIMNIAWADEASSEGDPEIAVLRGSPHNNTCEYTKLFDGDTNTDWVGSSKDCHVVFKLPESKVLTGYTLVDAQSTAQYYGRHWKNWTLYGANFESNMEATLSGEDWVKIDVRKNSGYTGEKQSFTISEPASYQYYMIHVTEVGVTKIETSEESDIQQMAEIELTFAGSVPTSVEAIQVIPTTGQEIYDIMGCRQQSLSRGVNIIRQPDGSVKKVLVK